uniref:Uncharacterized protein n=1 Tax=Bicosoecida sp. CB-2014 TaxID=1486930 RepID=A0A7S1CFS3_9STRA|mmetsp:Transcript_25248/g.88070  ORF Transcript_25248/g.88070 Transcript_25248/m.88070 type:complete len:736 (+) Transcript_25248:372-2579(+)
MELPELEREYKPMRELVRERLLWSLRYAKSHFAHGGQTVLVLDQLSKRILSSALTLFELYEAGFVLVENIKAGRQRCPNFDVVYLVNPNKKNISRILKDYRRMDVLPPSAQQKDCMEKMFPCLFPDLVLPNVPPRYRNATICITSGSTREVEERVKETARKDKERNRFSRNLKAVTELGIQFLPIERDFFSLDLPNALADLYSPRREKSQVAKRVQDIAVRLTSALAALNEYPYIRYKGGSLNEVARDVANETQGMIDEYFRVNKTLSPWGLGSGKRGSEPLRKDRAVLIILDRTEDLAAPLLHEFTYQAMVYDVLKAEPSVPYTYKTKTASGPQAKKKHTVMLDDNDPVWVELRHLHATKAIKVSMAAVQAQSESASGKAAAGGLDGKDMGALAAVVQELATADRERQAKNVQHHRMITDMMDKFQKYRLDDLALLEQQMATGVDGEGKAVNRSKLAKELDEWLSDDSGLSTERRARLLALYIISQGGIDNAKGGMELLDNALDAEHVNGILNLVYLGVDVKAKKSKKEKDSRKDIALAAKRAQEAEFEMSRFVPAIADRVAEHLTDELSHEDFPYIFPPPAVLEAEVGGGSGGGSGRDPGASAEVSSAAKSKRSNKTKHRWEAAGARATPVAAAGEEESKDVVADDPVGFTGGRVIVFVIGGMTFSESRALTELSRQHGREIVFGSTSVLTPKLFLEQLNELKLMDEDSDDAGAARGGAGGDDADLDDVELEM